MITGATLALALQAAPAPESQQAWIAYMTVHAKQLASAELALAQRYASCMSMPYFPMPEQFAAKREKCRASSEVHPNPELVGVLDHLDSLVRNHPGSEASLKVTKE